MAPKKILYIEDNPINRQLVNRILTQAGYVVLEAEDGLSGIQVAKRERPDLILMDIMLPGMDGYQAATRLKSLPELRDVPIVALTAKVMRGDRERALVAGCDGYISKPIDIDFLCDQVSEFLRGKREKIGGDAETRLALQQEYTQELVQQLEEKIQALQRANAELRHTDELKSKFIGMASHELRTPLAVIQGYLTIMENALADQIAALDPAVATSMAGINKGLERLKAIVEDMLDVVRIETKTLTVHRELVVLHQVVLSAIQKLQATATERHLEIHVDGLETLPLLLADAQRLHQALFNLLSNAIKYTPDGGHIYVSGQVITQPKPKQAKRLPRYAERYIQLVIEDTGIGIAPEEQERIFDLFYEVRDTNLHSTSKTRFMGGGLGLGLAIARGIIEAHNGLLWVESEGCDQKRRPGSRFYVLLPLEV